jgi:hypothetical protein
VTRMEGRSSGQMRAEDVATREPESAAGKLKTDKAAPVHRIGAWPFRAVEALPVRRWATHEQSAACQTQSLARLNNTHSKARRGTQDAAGGTYPASTADDREEHQQS